MMKNKILQLVSYVLILAVTACGFKPVYAQNSQSRAEFQQISISEISGRDGQILRSKLQDLLGAAGNKYRLDVVLSKERREFGIQEDLRISRYDIVMTANYSLYENATGLTILKDTAKMYSSFNRTDSEFSTFVAEEDAIEQAVEQLAHRINLKLASFFEKN